MSVYPTGIDSFTTKVDNVDDVMATDVNNLQSSIVNIENVIGLSGSYNFPIARQIMANPLTNLPISTGNGIATRFLLTGVPVVYDRVAVYDTNSITLTLYDVLSTSEFNLLYSGAPNQNYIFVSGSNLVFRGSNSLGGWSSGTYLTRFQYSS